MVSQNLKEIIDYIVGQGVAALKQFTNEPNFVLDYLAIFSNNESEYNTFISIAQPLGKEIDPETVKTGRTFLLQEPIETSHGALRLIKIRKPDPTRPQRGAPDFKVPNYEEFKNRYLKSSGNFTLMLRDNYEMIELKGVDVLVYIPSVTTSERLGLK